MNEFISVILYETDTPKYYGMSACINYVNIGFYATELFNIFHFDAHHVVCFAIADDEHLTIA